MEKPPQHKQNPSKFDLRPLVWDSGSSLYDSFELKSFERQLDSAISSRSLSMPHLSDSRSNHPQPPPNPSPTKKQSRISRSLQKLLRSIFRPKQNNSAVFQPRDTLYAVRDRSAILTTIPEVPETMAEYDGLSPEISSLVRKTASERFAATSIGISCN